MPINIPNIDQEFQLRANFAAGGTALDVFMLTRRAILPLALRGGIIGDYVRATAVDLDMVFTA